jgi:hypothetical protein
MNGKDELRELAMTVGRGLEAYVSVHDAVFHEASTFKSFLKNLVGRSVPMSKLLEDSESLLPMWDAIHERMEAFRRSTYSCLTTDEAHYFHVPSRYVVAIRRTIAALIDRQQMLTKGVRENQIIP